MTRDEYRQKSIEMLDYYPHYAKKTHFVVLLKSCASDLFMKGDLDSRFAKETRRRLTQINNLGWTDED